MTTTTELFRDDLVFSRAVKAVQEHMGTRERNARARRDEGWRREIGADLVAFIAERRSLYLGTASADGRPYIQHRGGPKGFLRVLGATTLGFADFDGGGQFITLGNLAENDKAFIFLMDYLERRRVKLWGRAHIVEDDSWMMNRLAHPDFREEPRRGIVFEVEAWDVNGPNHIPQFVALEDVQAIIDEHRQRIAELEQRITGLTKVMAT
ncbi:MAG: pyridoxamine 5'-phosphate oxidase family protein [Alphaproteobacteria bacterium]